MPFDSLPQESQQTTLFRQRRQAAADLWLMVPDDKFDLRDWQCGTKACALGWLARLRFDGWEMRSGVPVWSGEAIGTHYYAAAVYFGLTDQHARQCFGPDRDTAVFHGHRGITRVTTADIGAKLLSLPYATNKED